jgi:hypothetical protein
MKLRKRERAIRAYRKAKKRARQFDSEKEEAVACFIVLIVILVVVTIRRWL